MVDNSLLINPTKCNAMRFGDANRLDFELKILISAIEIVDLHKCLGIYIDNNLIFEKHIELIHGKIVGTFPSIYSNCTYLPQCIKFRLAHVLLIL